MEYVYLQNCGDGLQGAVAGPSTNYIIKAATISIS